MSGYWIGRTKVRDFEGMKRYAELVARAGTPYTPIVRAAPSIVLEGPDDLERHVLLRFGSVEDAVRFYNSPEYQEAAAVRHACCEDSRLVIVEGLD
jgi:uncharacterized protein (DUF1330 family)